jgi:hypothetical protein
MRLQSRNLLRFLLLVALAGALGPLAGSWAAPAVGCRPLLSIPTARMTCFPPARAAEAEQRLLAGAVSPVHTVLRVTQLRLTQVLLLDSPGTGADRTPPFALVYVFGTPPPRGSRLPCTAPARPQYLVVAETTGRPLSLWIPGDCPRRVQTMLPVRNLVLEIESNLGYATDLAVLRRLAAVLTPAPRQAPSPGGAAVSPVPTGSQAGGTAVAGPGATGVAVPSTPGAGTPTPGGMSSLRSQLQPVQ